MPATTPWWKSKAVIATGLSIITGLPALAQQIQAIDFIPIGVKNTLFVISVICFWLAPILNRASAESMGKRLEVVADTAHIKADAANASALEVAAVTAQVSETVRKIERAQEVGRL